MPNGEEKAKSEGATTFNRAHASPLRSRTASIKALTSVGNCRKLATVKVLSADANGAIGVAAFASSADTHHNISMHTTPSPALRSATFSSRNAFVILSIQFYSKLKSEMSTTPSLPDTVAEGCHVRTCISGIETLVKSHSRNR